MTHHVLMCEPVHFRIAYEINPWMRRANAVKGERALEQWRALRTVLLELDVRIELVDQPHDVPDMTFTANAGVVAGRRFIPANFRFPERRLEESHFVEWFEAHGYVTEPIHEPHYWEGEGDVLPLPDEPKRVFSGHRFRSEPGAIEHLDAALGEESVRLELADPRFYHLDTCFCPLGEGRALYYPPAFDGPSRAALEDAFDDLIAVPEAEAQRFACNALVVDDAVVLNGGCPQTARALSQRGLRVVETPTDEFIKAGGSVKCLVLMLDAFQ